MDRDGTIASNGGTFTLTAGMQIQGNGVWAASGAGATPTTINNDDPALPVDVGIVRNTSTGTAALDNVVISPSPKVASPGFVTVQTGTLRLGQGLPTSTVSSTFTTTVSAGATIEYAGGNQAVSGAVSGAGTVLVSGASFNPTAAFTPGVLAVTAGSANFNNPVAVTPGRIDVSGGTALFNTAASSAGGGSLSGFGILEIQGANTLSLTGGTFAWNGGTLRGPGTLLVNATGAILNIATGAVHTMEGAAKLDHTTGTVNWAADRSRWAPSAGSIRSPTVRRGTLRRTARSRPPAGRQPDVLQHGRRVRSPSPRAGTTTALPFRSTTTERSRSTAAR